jgi:hypothetical protein
MKQDFRYVLQEGERVCGEWLMQAHGTIYKLPHEPLVIFDLMKDHTRLQYDALLNRVKQGGFTVPKLLHRGNTISIQYAIDILGEHGYHGAVDKAEGCVWRIERKGVVDFLVKYVRPEKTDGIYLPEISKKEPIWNWFPNK